MCGSAQGLSRWSRPKPLVRTRAGRVSFQCGRQRRPVPPFSHYTRVSFKRAQRIAIYLALLVAILAPLAAFLPVAPHGRFATPQVACTADAYYEFSNGECWQVPFSGEKAREGRENRQFVGHYRKAHGRWIVDAGDGKPGQVRATLFSLQFIESDGRRTGPFYRYWH